MSLSYTNFLVNLANEIDTLTKGFVFDGYSALAAYLRAPLGAMIVLYIVLVGYAMVRGLIKSPQQELFKFTLRAGCIYLCAMNWAFFSAHIRDLFVAGSESIATTLMKAVHKNASHASINQGFQDVLNEVITLGGTLFEMGSLRKITPYFAGIMVLFSGIATIGLAFMEIVIAKLMLAVTLATAPIFIAFTLFDQTKTFFERWLGLLVGFSFVLVFVSSVVGLCIYLIHWAVAQFSTASGAELNVSVWVPLFIVSCLCVMSVSQAVSIGKSIGNAFCTSHASQMVGGFIRQMSGSTRQMQNLAKQAYGNVLKTPMDYAKNGMQQATHGQANRLYQAIRRGNA